VDAQSDEQGRTKINEKGAARETKGPAAALHPEADELWTAALAAPPELAVFVTDGAVNQHAGAGAASVCSAAPVEAAAVAVAAAGDDSLSVSDCIIVRRCRLRAAAAGGLELRSLTDTAVSIVASSV